MFSEGLTAGGAGDSALLARPGVGENPSSPLACGAIPGLEVLAVDVASRAAELPPLSRIRFLELASELLDGWLGAGEGACEFTQNGNLDIPDLVVAVLIQELALEYAGNPLSPSAAKSGLWRYGALSWVLARESQAEWLHVWSRVERIRRVLATHGFALDSRQFR